MESTTMVLASSSLPSPPCSSSPSSLRVTTPTSNLSLSSPSPPIPNAGRSFYYSSTREGRRTILLAAASLLLGAVHHSNSITSSPCQIARAEEADEFPQDEERIVRIFQESSPSVVFIKDLELTEDPRRRRRRSSVASTTSPVGENDERDAKIEGTGSGFVWDKAGHIVTNYHVIAKLATDSTGLQRCKVFLEDSNGNAFANEGTLIGFDPAYDLAVLKVNVEGDKLRPAVIGTSHDLHVGQSCFAIGNPYGYEHTLTTGVVSGLGREIPSPNGRPIRGAIQTDAAINAGNSGGPLIDSYGHVIGVNTATFTRKGTGISSGVNFAIPIDVVVRTVPNLIIYGTSVSNRF